jgi:endonuclease/exonuclease/phosphatase family metal-dependent hydrolase
MPRFVLAGVAFAYVALSSIAADPPATTLRVLSYNVHHCEGVDGKLDVARIAKVIADQKPDLVAVQEVDVNTTRTNKVDQAKELGKLTGLNVEFAKAIDFQGGEYGQVILSKFPIGKPAVHPLPGKPGQEKRVVAEVKVPAATGRPAFTFLGTHFAHDDAKMREEQAAKVNELFTTGDEPTILAGDLNATPESSPMKALAGHWAFATAPAKDFLTIPAEKPRSHIDFVLVRPAARFKVVEAKVIPEAVASDHRPVLAVVDLLGK